MTSFSLLVPQLFVRGPAELAVQLPQGLGRLLRCLVEVAAEVVHVVHRQHELEALGADRVGVQPDQVELGPGAHRVPLVDGAVPHRVAVVVLGHRPGELRAGVDEQLRPLVGVEVAARGLQLGRELHPVARLVPGAVDEVVVRPRRRVTVDLLVVVVLRGAVEVHAPRVPLVGERRDAEHAPVEVDAELRVLEPLRRGRVLVHRRPGRGVAAGSRGGPCHSGPQQPGGRGGPGGDEEQATSELVHRLGHGGTFHAGGIAPSGNVFPLWLNSFGRPG